MNKLSDKEIQRYIDELHSDWEIKDNAIMRNFVLKNFIQAFSFMSEIASIAENQQHHPKWSNNYNLVFISLTTHDAGGLTIKDAELAMEIERVYKKYIS